MVYHSAFNEDAAGSSRACGCALLPICTQSQGAAAAAQADVVDEAINLFRPNAFFQDFDIRGSGDKLLIYLSLFIACCLKRLATNTAQCEVEKVLGDLAQQPFKGPGDAGFALDGIMSAPADAHERVIIQKYLQQARQETARRLAVRACNGDGTLNKWWLAFGSRNFLRKSLS